MILILSNPSDQTTNEVIKWLNYFEAKWIRLDYTEKVTVESVRMNSYEKAYFQLRLENGKCIDSRKITAYWYRRSDFQLGYDLSLHSIVEDGLRNSLSGHMSKELNYLRLGIHALLQELPNISDYRTANLNKIDVLMMAKKVGLRIPDTLITDQRAVVRNFEKHGKGIISKAIQNGNRFKIKDEEGSFEYLCYTEKFKGEELNSWFFPSLFQEQIHKAFELRVFYLCGKFYPMAIFSQKDEQTKVDFRNYNLKRPNRTVPVELPDRIEQKLLSLMISLNLNSGSIDMIVTHEEEYVFLEVNSVGQFGMVSAPCHYNLFQIVAEKLINPDQWMKN